MSYIVERKGRFYVVWYDNRTRKKVWESLSAFAGEPVRTARAARRAHDLWIAAERKRPARKTDMTTFIGAFREESREWKTKTTWQSDNGRLNRFESWVRDQGIRSPTDLKRHQVAQFIRELDVGPVTKRLYLVTVRALYNWGMDMEYVTENPAYRLKAPPNLNPVVKRALTDDELALIEKRFTAPWLQFAMLGYLAGLRLSEIIYLAWDDIDFDRAEITVCGKPEFAHQPKGVRHRDRFDVVPMIPALAVALTALPRSGRFVFDRGDNRPLYIARSRWAAMLNAEYKRHGLDVTGAHILRHTFVTNLTRAGVDVLSTQRLARHKSVTTTVAYTHLDRKHLHDAISKLAGISSTESSTESLRAVT